MLLCHLIIMSSKETHTILSFINQMLMDEEDDELGNMSSMLHDSFALQATEQSMYEAINNNFHQESTSYIADTTNYAPFTSDHHHDSSEQDFEKYQHREDDHLVEYHRSNKHMACGTNAAEPEPLKVRNEQLLSAKKSKKKSSKGKKREVAKESVDLKNLLMQCAESIADLDRKQVSGLISQIRRHSSPHGSAAERVAHYFTNALEARLAGTGTALQSSLNTNGISGADILKCNKMFITAIPFMTVTSQLANGTVMAKVAKEEATTLHIIDFGLLYGFQWPSLIIALSEWPRGPPKLRITGIDFSQSAERVLDTGARLAEYCEKLAVPFEFNAIAQKWDTIELEDLKIQKGELVVVNSIYRLHNVMEQVDMESMKVPRDDILNLIRRINPKIFVHGVVSGTHNAPFFVARFREAFYHFLAMFDMFEATVPPEEEEEQSARVFFEDHILGRSAMNVVACEGMDRVERPESYKQWHSRTVRAGFRQISLDKDIVKLVSMAREEYHRGFSVARDGKWILLEWKGRVIHGVSCWQPLHY